MDFDCPENVARTDGEQSETGGDFRVSFESRAKQEQGAHLYFIKMEGSRPVKIGRANRPEVRLATLQVGSPYRLSLLGVVHNCGAHEFDFHWYLRADRMLGEWFKWSRKVEQTVKLTIGGGDWRSLVKQPDSPPMPDEWWIGSPLYEFREQQAGAPKGSRHE